MTNVDADMLCKRCHITKSRRSLSGVDKFHNNFLPIVGGLLGTVFD